MFKNGMRPIDPGEVLLEDYIKPMGVSVRALSMALCLKRYFGSDTQGWLALQAAYDLRIAENSTPKPSAKKSCLWPWPLLDACSLDDHPALKDHNERVGLELDTPALH